MKKIFLSLLSVIILISICSCIPLKIPSLNFSILEFADITSYIDEEVYQNIYFFSSYDDLVDSMDIGQPENKNSNEGIYSIFNKIFFQDNDLILFYSKHLSINEFNFISATLDQKQVTLKMESKTPSSKDILTYAISIHQKTNAYQALYMLDEQLYEPKSPYCIAEITRLNTDSLFIDEPYHKSYIRSTQELNDFDDRLSVYGQDYSNLDYLSLYDDTFFETNDIFIFLWKAGVVLCQYYYLMRRHIGNEFMCWFYIVHGRDAAVTTDVLFMEIPKNANVSYKFSRSPGSKFVLANEPLIEKPYFMITNRNTLLDIVHDDPSFDIFDDAFFENNSLLYYLPNGMIPYFVFVYFVFYIGKNAYLGFFLDDSSNCKSPIFVTIPKNINQIFISSFSYNFYLKLDIRTDSLYLQH